MTLTDGMWEGERVWVVGGGQSLYGFDWSLLKGERVIAVNRAYEKVPTALVCSMDQLFWKLHGEKSSRLHFNARGQLGALRFEGNRWDNPPRVHVGKPINYHGPTHTVPCLGTGSNAHLQAVWGRRLETGLGCGGNSGFAAVNLADVLGARKIMLLGFDMRGGPDGKQLNWHDGYLDRQRNEVYDRMRAAFEAVADEIRAEVVNVHLRSAMGSFPRLPLDVVLQGASRERESSAAALATRQKSGDGE